MLIMFYRHWMKILMNRAKCPLQNITEILLDNKVKDNTDNNIIMPNMNAVNSQFIDHLLIVRIINY